MEEFDDEFNSAASNLTTTRQPSTWLSELNESQRLAVSNLDGSVLVLAGAGTGKTRVLMARLAELIHNQKARPYQILCVTFTNKAANEMKSRVKSLIGEQARNIWLGTFHSTAAKILRKHAELVDLKPSFTILDSDDQLRLIKKIIEEEEEITVDIKEYPPRFVNRVIQRWKDRGESWSDVRIKKNKEREAKYIYETNIKKIYKFYQERMKSLNAVDFGDLLLFNLKIFKHHSNILEYYQDKFHYILVDEYQDTNLAQYLWLRFLSQSHKNICCVGDDDQSIYSWRGAVVGNMLNFEKNFPPATIVRLERNYRSTLNILQAASGLIAMNKHRLGKVLWTENNQGEKITVIGFRDSNEEAYHIINKISTMVSSGASYRDLAILVRAGFIMRGFEEQLLKFSIPYKVVGGLRFYDREEIRDAIAYLRLIRNSSDNLAFDRIVNKPARGIGSTLIKAIIQFSRTKQLSYFEASVELCSSNILKAQQVAKLSAFVNMIRKWQEQAWDEDNLLPLDDLLTKVLTDSNYLDMWVKKLAIDPKAESKLENLHEMILAIKDYDSLEQFLEHVALVSDRDTIEDDNMVSLMTLHASKGLEFPYIFLPAWEEDLFPHSRAVSEDGSSGLEEERRLAYVGLTRAKEKVCISYTAFRVVHGMSRYPSLSSFIDELPSDNVSLIRGGDLGGGLSMPIGDSHSVSDGFNGDNFSPVSTSDNTRISHFWNTGDKCHHDKFGVGVIVKGGGDIVHVKFVNGGEYTISGDFLNII